MDIINLSKKIRSILYRNYDSESVKIQIKDLLQSYEYLNEIYVDEDRHKIVVEIPDIIQYTRNKKTPTRIYERNLQ